MSRTWKSPRSLLRRSVKLSLLTAWLVLSPLTQADTLRIAYIDPLSGPFAAVGQNIFNSYQFLIDKANREKWAGEHKLEMTGFDNKASPQESLNVLKNVIDKGYRVIVQGNSSGVGLALIEAINKYNERNPGKEVLYLNHTAVDPDMTNSKCSFWHFRFDSNSDMKLEALTSYMAARTEIKKVYIIGQNYTLGHQVSRATKDYLKRKRADIQIVGDDLHPIGQVKDFAPYIAKIKASGADAVVSANWGPDLSLLIKAAKDAELPAHFYTFYANSVGVPVAMGSAGIDRVRYIGNWNVNNEGFVGKDIIEGYKAGYKDDFYAVMTYTLLAALAQAYKQTQSSDATKLALALEGMSFKSLNGEVQMRKTDHQLQQNMFIASWAKLDGKGIRYDQENTGLGWKTEKKIDAYVAAQPSSCQMKRPRS